MKKLKTNLFFLFIISMFFFSCSRDDVNQADQTENKTISSSTAKYVVNNANPYSNIGTLHNEFMLQMHNNSTINSQNDIYNAGVAFAQQNGYNTNLYNVGQMKAAINDAMNTSFTKAKIDQLGAQYGFSGAYKNELYQLANFFNATNYTDTDQILNDLANLEIRYINAQLPTAEKNQLLVVIAIARASMSYWIAYYPTDTQNSGVTKASWWGRIFGGAVADAFGALAGGAIGFAAGGVGAVVGAIIGGACASGGIQFAIEY
ncbi:hypothetical protein [Chryseobacterium paridis]|uniref:Glycine zipper family protein n=1 Tax=Chryseobacterium paridis TaxID=2800328 RepID=A0ABS1FQQ3_9FLAO|nr:hypothetical protein [Chryseobacterium paridis]MBK1894733.1 hypothetical protein [Chryseobacterium paridis]